MSSATLTEPEEAGVATADAEGAPAGTSTWHVWALLGMAAAAVAVWVSTHTHPVALILLSAAALAAAAVGLTMHRSLAAFLGRYDDVAPLPERRRDVLLKEKSLVLRSIKELDFDRAMGKVGDADYEELIARLRARALTLMQDLDRPVAERPAPQRSRATPRRASCAGCGTTNDPDARFCKSCGKALA